VERREVDCFKCNECNNIEFRITIHLVRTYRCLEFYSLLQEEEVQPIIFRIQQYLSVCYSLMSA